MENDEKVKLLQKLIQINTVNGNEEDEANYIKRVLEAHHISCKLVSFAPNRTNLIAEIGNDKGPVLALAGHLDTVDPSDPQKWTYPPFAGQLADGKIYGRGAVDMKSGLAAMVGALIELKEADLPKHGKVRLIATVEEDVGGKGSLELTDQGYVHDVDAMIIGEATTGQIEYAHCGSFDYIVESHGKLAHSSQPELGANAVMNLVKFINKESRAFDDAAVSPTLGKLIHSVTVFHGGDQLNSIPDFAYLKGNVRTIPECDNVETQKRLQDIIDGLNKEPKIQLKLKVVASFMPVVTNKQDRFIALAQTAIKKVSGRQPDVVISHGATDASRYVLDNHNFPIIEYGPGIEKLSHQIDERIALDDYLTAQQAYVEIAKQYLNNTKDDEQASS